MLLPAFCLYTQIILLTGYELPKPGISLTKTLLTEKGTLQVTCDVPEDKRPLQCSLHLDGQQSPMQTELVRSGLCEFHVTGEELLGGRTDKAQYTIVRLSCAYSVGDQHSERSQMMEVKVLGELKAPQLTVKPNVISKGDTAELHCLVHPSISRCYFQIGGEAFDQNTSECLRSYSWDDLRQTGNHSADTEIKVQCKYSQQIDGHEAPSQDSNVSIVTLLANSTVDPVSAAPWNKAGTVGVACAVTVILLGAAAVVLYRRHRNQKSKRQLPDHDASVRMAKPSSDTQSCNNVIYSLISDAPTDPVTQEENKVPSLIDKPDADHCYATICEEPPASINATTIYSTVQQQ
ncbi:uncharacterized protein [Paramormyrops kingsleyae]|uniref:uncharacterized protein isoform X5 n=1 Tax=Paramormyrops kingsleyae TaxID=1676925 RepID=UPI003B96F4A8